MGDSIIGPAETVGGLFLPKTVFAVNRQEVQVRPAFGNRTEGKITSPPLLLISLLRTSEVSLGGATHLHR